MLTKINDKTWASLKGVEEIAIHDKYLFGLQKYYVTITTGKVVYDSEEFLTFDEAEKYALEMVSIANLE